MLVITRKCDQELVIGGGIRLKVLSVKGNRVRLGIDAPREVGVHRSELVAPCKALADALNGCSSQPVLSVV